MDFYLKSISKNHILYAINKSVDVFTKLVLVDCIDISTPLNMTKMGF